MPFTYPYPRPAVTVDVALFAIVGGELAVLLIRRAHDPFAGRWALPGGFVDEHEPLVRAALRELEEETGVKGVTLEQLGAFGDPGRDPRGHTVSVVYVAFVSAEAHPVTAGDDAAAAHWQPVSRIGRRGRGALALAFDHATIVPLALDRLRQALRDPGHHPVAQGIVPPRFTLRELTRVCDAVVGNPTRTKALVAYLRKERLVEPAGGARAARAPRGARGARSAHGARTAHVLRATRTSQLYRWRLRASSR